jgi:NADH:ubiquinone oxidoreductase subunit D
LYTYFFDLINKSNISASDFAHLQNIAFILKAHLIANVVTIMETQDIIFGEIDR